MLLLRSARPEDEPALLELTRRLALFPPPPWRTREEIVLADHPILVGALRHPADENSILVAENGGTIAGFVFSTTKQDYFTGRDHAHIEVLAVAESAEGQGVGRALLQGAEAWARVRGYPHITLNVFAVNERARAIYERNGYGQETVHYLKPL
jgi:ribosomal protein S18 acetylase RimI-like enzyme